MEPGRKLAMEFADLASRLQGSDFDMTLNEVLRAAMDAVRADMGGVMLVRRGAVESAAVTDDLVLRADQLQHESGDGPCLSAIDDQQSFCIRDTATDGRWPNWGAAVNDLGIRSVVSVALKSAPGLLGALNLYSTTPENFSDDDVADATILARHASVALAADKEREELRQAIDGRHMIGMAQGILMERFDLDREQAFAVLRRYSQDRNVKLRTVASQLVESRALPS